MLIKEKKTYKSEATVISQKLKFSVKDFLSKCEQIHSFLRIFTHLLKKYLTENFIFVKKL